MVLSGLMGGGGVVLSGVWGWVSSLKRGMGVGSSLKRGMGVGE